MQGHGQGRAAGRRQTASGRRGGPPRRAVTLVLLLVVAVAAAVLHSAPPASAAVTVSPRIQLRAITDNCLSADTLTVGSRVLMQPCSSTAATRRTWNIIQFDPAASARGLALSDAPGLCLGTASNSSAAGATTVLRNCEPVANPSIKWASDLKVGVPGKVHHVASGRCLDVFFAQTSPGTQTWLYDCNNDSAAQTWVIGAAVHAGNVVGHGLNCLTASSAAPATGSPVLMQPCTGAANQTWVYVNNFLTLGGKCLDVRGASTANNTVVQTWSCVDVPQQRWREQTSGVFRSDIFVCLTVAGGGTAPGTPAWSSACANSGTQGWYLGRLPDRLVDTSALATKLNAAIAARTASCRGMVRFRVDNVDVVAMKNPAPLLVRRAAGGTFTSAALAAGAGTWTNRAVINGPFFNEDPKFGFLYQAQGDVWSGGVPVWSNPYNDRPGAYHGFYVTVASMTCGSQWSIGPQDPALFELGARPGARVYAVGGARPLITNGVRWGTSSSGYRQWPAAAVGTFDTYEAILTSATNGKPTIGVRGDGIVMLMVQRQDFPLESGKRLSEIRDAYFLLGFRDALMFDANSSTTLAVNGSLVATPSSTRDGRIPFGIGIATRAR